MKKHCDNCTCLAVDDRELATILAALRFHQAENLQGSSCIPDQAICEIATEMDRLDVLTFDEVERLCQRLNIADRDVMALAASELPRRQNVPEGIQRIHDLLYLDIVDDQDVYNPDKEWDVDTLSMIAEVVAAHIPRPGEQVDVPDRVARRGDLSPDVTVMLAVTGGVGELLAKPKGVAVVIYDYDMEGSDEGESNVSRDPDGQFCSIAEWTAMEEIASKIHWPAVQAAMEAGYSRLWHCPDCCCTTRVVYEELAVVGAPICTDCDRPMEVL